jgi:hypothetical protein
VPPQGLHDAAGHAHLPSAQLPGGSSGGRTRSTERGGGVASITEAAAGREEAGTSGKRQEAGEGDDAQGEEAGEKEEERYAMLEFVVKALNEALVTELLEGFH